MNLSNNESHDSPSSSVTNDLPRRAFIRRASVGGVLAANPALTAGLIWTAGAEFAGAVTTGGPTTTSPGTTTIYALHLIQNNWPNRNGANTDIVDTGLGQVRTVQDIIPGAAIAYINGEPEIPELLARIEGPGGVPLLNSDVVDWYFEIETERSERGTLDDRRVPTINTIALPGDEHFNIGDAFGGEFVGGNVTLYYSSTKCTGAKTFKIRGANPLDAKAKAYVNYINTNAHSGKYPWAFAVVQHESRQPTNNTVYNQFNSAGLLIALPNFSANGSDNGWGAAQLDNPLGANASTNEVYNWKMNIDKFFSELEEKEDFTDLYFAAVASTWPAAYEAPPNYTPPNTTTSLTAKDASIIKLYNGGGATVYIVGGNVSETGTIDQLLPVAWAFDPDQPSGSRWTFLDSAGYVEQVIDREYDTPWSYSD